jgi:ATP-dependent DNA ligase
MRRRVAASGIAQPAAHGSPAAGLPAWIKPQLTQLVETAPEGDGWLHEIKYDGFRMESSVEE